MKISTSLRTHLEQLVKIADKRDEVHFSFIKQILLMASGLLGILVSLHKVNATDQFTRVAFSLALGLLALGILLLTVALSAQVTTHKKIFMKWKEEILSHVKDEGYEPKMVFTEPSKIYSGCEKLGYCSLAISIVFLTIYAILIA